MDVIDLTNHAGARRAYATSTDVADRIVALERLIALHKRSRFWARLSGLWFGAVIADLLHFFGGPVKLGVTLAASVATIGALLWSARKHMKETRA